MNILIDTHILIWAISDESKLTKYEKQLLENPTNTIYVSAVSLWEIGIKYANDKLKIKGIIPLYIPKIIQTIGFELINLTPEESAGMFSLPKNDHSDPFDRMLIWQAIHNQYSFMTRDKENMSYQAFGLNIISKETKRLRLQ